MNATEKKQRAAKMILQALNVPASGGYDNEEATRQITAGIMKMTWTQVFYLLDAHGISGPDFYRS